MALGESAMTFRTTLCTAAAAILAFAAPSLADPPKTPSVSETIRALQPSPDRPEAVTGAGLLIFMDSYFCSVAGGMAPFDPSAVPAQTLLAPSYGGITSSFLHALCAPPPAGPSSVLIKNAAKDPKEKPPYEGADREIQILPSLVTFFCNPYAPGGGGLDDGPAGLSSETVEEINLGIMGEIEDGVRVALFSTLSMFQFRGESIPFVDRRDFIQERMTHRFSFLLAYSPEPHLTFGAAGGAEVLETPRTYTFELLLEARARF